MERSVEKLSRINYNPLETVHIRIIGNFGILVAPNANLMSGAVSIINNVSISLLTELRNI